MEMVKQRHETDCFNTVISILSGIPYEEVPYFYQAWLDTGENMELLAFDFLLKRNLMLSVLTVEEWLTRRDNQIYSNIEYVGGSVARLWDHAIAHEMIFDRDLNLHFDPLGRYGSLEKDMKILKIHVIYHMESSHER